VEISRGVTVLLTADDLPFGFDDIDAGDALARSSGGCLPPIIIGSKAHPASRVGRGAVRGVLASGFGLLRRLILRTRVRDSQGTFLVDGNLMRRLAPQIYESGFLFSTELVYLAERIGLQPTEVPVRISVDHGEHRSRVTPSDIASMAIGLIRIRMRHRAGWAVSPVSAESPPRP
jgi:dolichyl-phosphate beta-glucosyltransferase